ncbi:MAG TPA: hypothetical protein VGQ99_01640 [Tepidisphaeraceae bacterium]|jgi:hypothetical protein|nr:hypothetical protein [Tepidisphaeraceae bacterium]HEV8604035.1 hypothetical protein [Tepidisphaeraceae bacterium]
MKRAIFPALIFAMVAGGCGSGGKSPAGGRVVVAVTPPPMPRRNIAPPAVPPKGQQIQVESDGSIFVLFVPDGWSKSASRQIALTIHFHGAPWFAIDEHLRHGLRGPLLCFSPGEGSTIYRKAFEDQNRLGRLLGQVENELKHVGAPANAKITTVDISSFSAGYGAVREIVKSPEYCRIIRRIVLCDSMYASFAPNSTTRPAPEHIEPWIAFAKMAAKGEKTFVFTHSLVPTSSYANSAMCATALIDAVGGSKVKVVRGSLPATLEAEFPLLTRSDVGNFHVWGYDGADAPAHLTHVRHLADVWMALDAAGAP